MKKILSLVLSLMIAFGAFTAVAGALGYDVYVITGGYEWLDGWSPKINRNVMKKQSDGTYSKTVSHVPASGNSNYALKVVCFKNGDENEDIWLGPDGTDYDYEFRVTSECDVTVIYNPVTKKITATGSGVAEADYSIDKIIAVGTGENGFLNNISWDPDADDNKMTEVSPSVYEIEYTGVKANAVYQVKFAANGGWDRNWGSEEDTEVLFGTSSTAEYNGGNIVFTPESDDDFVSIKLRLDLTKWDHLTKKGATYTVWVNGDAPVSSDISVSGVSNYCSKISAETYQVGDTVTVVFTAPQDCDIVELEWGMDYDKKKLVLTGISTIAPDEMIIDPSADTYNVIGYAALSESPCRVDAGDDFMTFVFTAKAPGKASVDLRIVNMTVREDGSDVVAFDDGECLIEIKYNLWVGETQVTSDNKDDILGDGKVSFDPETNTLTLDKATVSGSHICSDNSTASIYADGMDLIVKGSGTIGSDTVGSALYVTDSSLTANSNLLLNGDFTFKGDYGIFVLGSLTIDGGSVISTGTVMSFGDCKVNAGVSRLEASGDNGTFGSFDGKLILDP